MKEKRYITKKNINITEAEYEKLKAEFSNVDEIIEEAAELKEKYNIETISDFYLHLESVCDRFDMTAKATKEDVITAPWKESSYVRCSRKLTKENIRCEETKYQATFYEGLDLTIAGYGFHSIAVGIILEQGRINAEKFDVTKIFPYVDVYPDLSFRYNEKNILKRLAEQEHHLSNEDVNLLSTRFY